MNSKNERSAVRHRTALGEIYYRRRVGRLRLLLPGSLLVAVGTKLLAPFMFVDLAFASFFQ